MAKKLASPKEKLRPKPKRPVGRPPIYSEELADEIIKLIAADNSLLQICSKPGMPDRNTVMKWEREIPEFSANIARAREQGQANAVFDAMVDIEGKLERGEIDAQAARTIIWSKQWRAGKLNRKKYGEKQEVEHSSTGSIVQLLEEIAAERALQRAAPIIEAKAIERKDEEEE